MGEIKRKFKCNGCGESRPCFLETNQSDFLGNCMPDLIYNLRCVLDETNQTSYNWVEIQANGDSKHLCECWEENWSYDKNGVDKFCTNCGTKEKEN